MEDAKTVTLEKDTDESIEPKAKSSFLENLKIVGIVLLALAVAFLANKAISYMGGYFLLIVLAIIIVAGSVHNKELLRRIVALIIIVSAFFGTAFLASKFNYNPDPDADILAGAVGLITIIGLFKFVLGVPNVIIFVFILLLLVGAVSMAMLAFVPSPMMSGILSMAFMVVGWGTIFYLCVLKSANGGDSDGGFDGNDGIFDGGGGDGIFGGDGIGGGGGDGGGGDGGGGDGGGD